VVAFIGLGVGLTLLFALTPLDLAAARLFYRPGAPEQWPLAAQLPWSVLYRMAPWITASLVVAGLAGLAAGIARRRAAWRRHAILVLLSVMLGPGLLINAVFKDHWERPRPRDTVEFGGPMHYVIAPLRGEGGASFPCGHCSVGFLYGVGWWLWKGRRRYCAGASLATGLLMGTGLGIGRMAAGGHFLSDVAWSAVLAFAVVHALYYYVLRIPAHEAAEVGAAVPEPRPRAQSLQVLLATLGGIAVLFALFVTPHGTQLATEIDLSSFAHPPRVLDVRADTANIEISVVDAPSNRVSISGELHGFGLPTSQLLALNQYSAAPVPTLHYRIEERGWFTDLDGMASVRVPVGRLAQIVVRVRRGNIKVTDDTRAGSVRNGLIRLDLRTAQGHLQYPSR
jgi:membrane-associated PAP2 superfamily phosphatase